MASTPAGKRGCRSYGSHPYGAYSAGISELRAYANDYAFMKAHREAQSSRERYDAWVREWILDMEDQEAYLAKLGNERLSAIHRSEEHTSELQSRATSYAVF